MKKIIFPEFYSSFGGIAKSDIIIIKYIKKLFKIRKSGLYLVIAIDIFLFIVDFIVVYSSYIIGSIEIPIEYFNILKSFLSFIVLPIFTGAAEYVTAILYVRRQEMD
jgi:hypothetical protein